MEKKVFRGKTSIKEAIEQNAFAGDLTMTRDQIKAGLKKDVYGVYVVLAEMLASNEVLEAITEVFWKRLLELREQKEKDKQGTLFNSETNAK